MYPDDNGGSTYPTPELGQAIQNYSDIRQELHCEIMVMYDDTLAEVDVELTLTGFDVSTLEFALNDTAANGDAIAGDDVFSRNISLNRIDTMDGSIYVKYRVGEETDDDKVLFFDTLTVSANLPPYITEISMPDTIVRPAPGKDGSETFKDLLISLTADDPNGAYDVTNAYFQVLSNSTGQWSSDYDMYDNGTEGDETAGDGEYSRGLFISSSNSAATNYFRFRVKDTAANFSEWSLDSVVVR